ncbi:SurA N-terminal domain-containing protein [Candidatus Saccharibacteria bacterium]|nr:SurA N-terminal domain-containing protein [Candidatus Saccharibacteria bacterium]
MNLKSLRKADDAAHKTEKEKVEERREEVLSRGRKFKYPLQYAKHKLVINTVIVAVVGVAALIAIGWAMLYKFQDMGDIMYRISLVVPVPVASVDGKDVKFSDYLMTARSTLEALDQQSAFDAREEDYKTVENSYKRQALTQAEELTYALKLGEELGIEVSSSEIQKAFDEHRKVGGAERSEESFLKVLNTNFGLSKDEYERMLYLSIMRSKVEQKIDTEAEKIALEVESKLSSNGGDFKKVKEELGDKVEYTSTGGLIDNKNVDGGRASKAMSMTSGTMSKRFLSSNGDGYYFVKTVDKTDMQVSYVSLYVKFTEFSKRFEQMKSAGSIREYIVLTDLNDSGKNS